jgi:hypothetical protein
MGAADAPGPPIDRPAESHANGLWRNSLAEFGQSSLDLAADALSTCAGIDHGSPAPFNFARSAAADELEFRAPDFDSDAMIASIWHRKKFYRTSRKRKMFVDASVKSSGMGLFARY